MANVRELDNNILGDNALDLVDHIGDRSEWCCLVRHLKENDAQGPDIRSHTHLDVGVRVQVQSLGSNIIECTNHRFSLYVGRVGLNGPRNAKVNQLENTFEAHKVGGLEIAMDDSLLVDDCHRFQHLLPVELDVVDLVPLR